MQEGDLMGIHHLFKPIAGSENPLYKNRTIIIIDRPNEGQQRKYQLFQDGYPYLFDN